MLLYHGLRREEAAGLLLTDLQDRRGIRHLRILSKRNKVRYLPLHPVAAERIHAYLELAGIDSCRWPGGCSGLLGGRR